MSEDDESDGIDWTYETGTVRIYEPRAGSVYLVEVERCETATAERYGAHFIQFPDKGRRSGGSVWASPPSQFRGPRTPEEMLWFVQYEGARRVLRLREELAEAEADEAATARFARLLHGAEFDRG